MKQAFIKPLITFLFLLGIISSSTAQGIEIATDTTKQRPLPINIVDIVDEIRETNNDIKLIKKKAIPSKALTTVDSLYPGYKAFLREQQAISEAFVTTNPNSAKIENRIKKWGSYKIKLDNWATTINAYNSRNAGLFDELSNKIQTWNLTYTNARTNEAPRELLNYVDGIRDSLYLTNEDLTKVTSKYLRLQTKVARLREIVDESILSLQNFKKSEQYSVFYKRHNNIWQPEDRDYTTNDDGKAALESYKSALVEFYEFIKSKPDIGINYSIWLLLIFLSFRYFRRAYIKYPLSEQNERLERYSNMLSHQNKLIIVFSALILLRFFLLGNERIFVDIISVLMMLAVIPIIKPYEPKFFGSFFYFLTGLYVLDAFKTYAWFSSVEYRLFLFLELVLCGVLILKYSTSFLLENKRDTKRFSKYFQYLRPFLLFFIVVAILANIFGYTNLSDLVMTVAIHSGIVSAYAYAFLLIIESAAMSMVYRHFERKGSTNRNQQLEIEDKTKSIVKVFVFIMWTVFFLNIIGKLDEVTEFFQLTLTEPYSVGSISFTLGAIISFFLVLFGSYSISKLVSFLLGDGEGVLKVFKLSKGIPTAIAVVVRYIILGVGFIFAISVLGIDLSTFNLMAGALGLGIGFGLQTIISNFVSGLILIFERPILPGDSVEVNNLWGTVNKIGVRASVINTYDGAEVIVPNNNLITNDLINWTLSSKIRRMEISIGTAYGSDPNKVIEILREAATNHPKVLKTPQPLPLFREFGDSSLNFTLWYWVYFENGFGSKSDISIDIYNRFDEAGIVIPFPQTDVHIKSLSKGDDLPSGDIGFKPSKD